ncbi:Auxin-responsive protein IAA18 [Ananas comosus]|uniref:Auxin-responsive protein n=1 Tax=Ananas comosus TaxID=4615 RepID=A0A199V092_ANACO|nr:Auxin-responsive protein IAA18 [Ananas comosus]
MEEDLTKGGGDPSPRLLDLIPKDETWMVRGKERVVAAAGGGSRDIDSEEERNLDLTLGLPGGEDYVKEIKTEEEGSSILSLGFFPKAPKPNTNVASGSKRGAFDEFEPNPEGTQQQKSGFFQVENKANLGKELSPMTKGKACFFPSAHDEGIRSSQGRNSAPVVGWPPVRSFRKNLASCSSKPSSEPPNVSSETSLNPENIQKGSLVKINMDGIPIGRKIDLQAYDSYEKLASAVEELFRGLLDARRDPSHAKGRENGEVEQPFCGLLDGTGEYTLVYEDFDGDRLFVGDVPWDEFVSAAKRLRVQKTSELSALPLEAVGRRKTKDC